MEKFTDKFYNVVRDAGNYIVSQAKEDPTDIYDLKNTLYEKILSDKYTGIHTLYELVSVQRDVLSDRVIVKGVDTVDKEEYDFTLSDLSPDVIVEIADKLAEL